MTEARLRELRHRVRTGQLPDDLLSELRAVARRLARQGGLPPSFAPYGRWDDEAADELFSSWYADRLLGRGDLQALLDRARTARGFNRLAERSLRQHVLNAQDRSQAQNLFRRVVAMLDEDAAFELTRAAARPQDRWYAERGARVSPWAGDDRLLAAHAWALGDFVVIRYRASSAKLSPVLDAEELHRFALELMRRAGGALTPGLIMRALAARFDLGAVEFVPHDDSLAMPSRSPGPDDEVLIRETSRAVISALSPRQREVLRRSDAETVAAMAAALTCSVGTVVNEQRRIGELVARLTENADERDRVLNVATDLLYLDDDA